MSLGQSIKRLFKHSAVYGIGHIFNRSIGFLLLPLYTNIFPKSEFGIAGLMFTYLAILKIFYTYGLDVAFFRFFMLEDEESEKNKIFTSAYASILVIAVLFSALLLFGAAPAARALFSHDAAQLDIDLTRLIRLASGILLFDALALLPLLLLRAKEKSLAFVLFNSVNVLANIAGNIVFLAVLHRGVEGIFYANLFASGLTFALTFPIALRHLTLTPSLQRLRELFAFGLPYLPSTLAVVVMDTIDRVFLERLAGVEEVGLYNAGAKLGMFMALFVAAFRFAWHPFFLATSKQPDAKQVFSRVFTYVMLVCLALFLTLSIFIDDVARFRFAGYSLIGEAFWDSTAVVPLIMLAYVFYAAYCNFLIGIYLYKKSGYLPYITAAAMAGNLVANTLLIPHWGMMGAAWARMIAYIIMAAALYVVAQRLYRIEYEWSRVIRLAVLVALLTAAGCSEAVQQRFLTKITVLALFPAGLLLTGILPLGRIRALLKK